MVVWASLGPLFQQGRAATADRRHCIDKKHRGVSVIVARGAFRHSLQ